MKSIKQSASATMESFKDKEKEKSEISKSKTSLKEDKSKSEIRNSNSATFITNGAGVASDAEEENKEKASEKPQE